MSEPTENTKTTLLHVLKVRGGPTPASIEIELDGNKVKGCRTIMFMAAMGNITVANLELMVSLDVEAELMEQGITVTMPQVIPEDMVMGDMTMEEALMELEAAMAGVKVVNTDPKPWGRLTTAVKVLTRHFLGQKGGDDD